MGVAKIPEREIINAVSLINNDVEYNTVRKIINDYHDEIYRNLKNNYDVSSKLGVYKIKALPDTVRYNPVLETTFIKPAQNVVYFAPSRGVRNLTNQ